VPAPVILMLRLIAIVGIGAAVVGQFVTSYNFWVREGLTDFGFRFTNMFSFFTMESNISAVVVLSMAVILAARREQPEWFAILRAAVATYMVTTGVVYNLLLRNVELPQGAVLEWSNEVLHVFGPLYMLLDWLFAPGRRRLEFRHIAWIVAFPIVWATYTLIRGPLTYDVLSDGPWYPYPFLNPANSPNGYLSVAFYVILVAAVIGLAGAGIIRISRPRIGQGDQAADAPREPVKA